ncbi:hypothetical protein BDV93DRAFT_547469 [Ceratobasidium sp. AG-I]|nr:hypothetical protein BDV93DRAFT_547469 [Ceratobasidium sp. AG-I]
MASPAPGASTGMFRHRITSIMLEPSTATRDISLKILVDGLEAHRLPAIQQGAALSWNHVPYCDVNSSSSVEIRVYEKHFLRTTRVGTLAYAVSDVGELTEATLDFDPPRFKAMLSFPTPEAESPGAALAKAQAMGQKTRPLERLGPTRAVLKAILDGGEIISERIIFNHDCFRQLNPVAKIVVSFCKIAWQTLEKQEECDASVEKLVVDLVRMLPFVDRIEKAAKLPQLQSTLRAMRDLIEDALEFIIKYKSDTGPGAYS